MIQVTLQHILHMYNIVAYKKMNPFEKWHKNKLEIMKPEYIRYILKYFYKSSENYIFEVISKVM